MVTVLSIIAAVLVWRWIDRHEVSVSGLFLVQCAFVISLLWLGFFVLGFLAAGHTDVTDNPVTWLIGGVPAGFFGLVLLKAKAPVEQKPSTSGTSSHDQAGPR